MNNSSKQPSLKAQDVVVLIKIAVNPNQNFLLTDLAKDLSMSLSVVHGSITRCEQARLISRSSGSIRSIRPAAREFVIHAVKYFFPGIAGSLTRGMFTSTSAPRFRDNFNNPDSLQTVWPTPDGDGYGTGIMPLHPSVPQACKKDALLYQALSVLDALRIGSARERELAALELERLLT